MTQQNALKLGTNSHSETAAAKAGTNPLLAHEVSRCRRRAARLTLQFLAVSASLTLLSPPALSQTTLKASSLVTSSGNTISELAHTSEYNNTSLHNSVTFSSLAVTSSTLSKMNVTNPVSLKKTVTNAGGKTCIVNNHEVPFGFSGSVFKGNAEPWYRFAASFNIDLTKLEIKNITTELVEAASGSSAPYRIKVSYELNDLSITTAKEADISVECLGFDRNITLSFSGMKGVVYVRAYGPKQIELSPPTFFAVEKGTASLSMNDIKVSTDAWLKIPNATILADIIADALNKKDSSGSSPKLDMAASISSAAGGGLGDVVATFANLTFSSKSGFKLGSKASDFSKVKSVSFSTSTRTGCDETPCALYEWK